MANRPHRTDLLPPERVARERRDYFARLAALVLMLATALVLVAGVLLAPTYLYLRSAATAKRARLDAITAGLASSDETALSTRLAALSNDAATLIALANTPSALGLMSELLAVPRTGVLLTGFEYTPASGKSAGTLSVTGVASTRDALRQYQLALQGAPFVASADLPVSVFAQNANIAFTVSITLAP
jgi:hypothetical protein